MHVADDLPAAEPLTVTRCTRPSEPNTTTALGDTAMNPTLTAATTGGYLKISVGGVNATNYPVVKWTARVEVTGSTN